MFDSLKGALSFIEGGSSFQSVNDIVLAVANVFIYIAFGLSFIAVAFSFIQYILSSGDIKNTEKAQRTLLWGAIGMFASLGAIALKYAIVKLFGFEGQY